MDVHVRTLAILNITFGVLGIIGVLAALLVLGGFGGLYASFDDPLVGLIVTILCVVQVLVSIPCIIGGRNLLKFDEWARTLITITSALNCLNLPVGTLLGAYGLWVLMTPETEPLFLENPRLQAMRAAEKAKKARAHPTGKPQAAKAGPAPPQDPNAPIIPSKLKRATGD